MNARKLAEEEHARARSAGDNYCLRSGWIHQRAAGAMTLISLLLTAAAAAAAAGEPERLTSRDVRPLPGDVRRRRRR